MLKTVEEIIALKGGSDEALFRPSSISRIIACPGSVVLAVKNPKHRETTLPQAEGTAAHAVAQSLLEGELTADEWRDRSITVDQFTIPVDEEMLEGAKLHHDVVKHYAKLGGKILVEQKLTLAGIDPSEPFWGENRGTGDAVVLDYENGWITIVDLKYGKHVMVAGDSPQLRDYALMAATVYPPKKGIGWIGIRTVIVQPRAQDITKRVKIAEYNIDELMDFTGVLYTAFTNALSDSPSLHEGSHCFWCPVKGYKCPLIKSNSLAIAQRAFEVLPMTVNSQVVAPSKLPVPPKATDLTNNEIASILERKKAYEKFIKSVEEEAIFRMENHQIVPGWDIEDKFGNREWKDKNSPDTVVKSLISLGVPEDKVYETRKPISVATAEKLPELSHKKVLLNMLYKRERSGYTLVREGEKVTAAPSTTLINASVETAAE